LELEPIGSMYAIYGNIYHQYTPNVSIYTIHGSYGEQLPVYSEFAETHGEQRCDSSDSSDECAARGIQRTNFLDQVTENIRKPWENTMTSCRSSPPSLVFIGSGKSPGGGHR
jgi:hypothetical protein